MFAQIALWRTPLASARAQTHSHEYECGTQECVRHKRTI
jgi:hypothetical protein